jgi:DNA-binding IclR family transcriptional regulator
MSMAVRNAENDGRDLKQADTKSIVNSVLRACRILELLAEEGPEVALSRIAEASTLSRPTAHRLLSTLVIAGWVRRTASGRYALTMRAFSVGSSASSSASLRELAAQAVAELAQATGDTAYLLVPDEGVALCVERIEGPHPVRVHEVNVGDTIGLLAGAAPLAMVAQSPELLTSPADKRRAAMPAMAARLATARRDGYVVSQDDVLAGVTAIGAPIFDREGAVIGGVSVTGVNDRYAGTHLAEAIRRVALAASDISQLMGYSAPAADSEH